MLHNNGKNMNSDFDSLVLMLLCLHWFRHSNKRTYKKRLSRESLFLSWKTKISVMVSLSDNDLPSTHNIDAFGGSCNLSALQVEDGSVSCGVPFALPCNSRKVRFRLADHHVGEVAPVVDDGLRTVNQDVLEVMEGVSLLIIIELHVDEFVAV